MRIAQHDKTIGDYKGHRSVRAGVLVKTTGGMARFLQTFILLQFENSEQINSQALLKKVLVSFKPA